MLRSGGDPGKKKAAPPVVKPPAASPFSAPNPLGPKVPKEVIAKAPPAPKAPQRRAQPAVGARGGAPHNPQIAPVSHDGIEGIKHAADILAGTAASVVKTIPSVLTTPVHPGQTHTAVEDVKPKTWAQALGVDPAHPAPKPKPYHAPSDYPDMFGPGRTHLSPDHQVETLKAGLSKEQAQHFNHNAVRHPLIASFLLAAADPSSKNPVPKGLIDYTRNVLKSMTPEQRSHAFAGVPNIQSHLLFDAANRKKNIQPLIDQGVLPDNPSDQQLLEYFHTHDANGKEINKKHGGSFLGNAIGDVGDIASGLAHAPLAIPAAIGALKHPETLPNFLAAAADPYIGFAAHPLNSLKQHHMLHDHPVQTALMVLPGAGAAVGKVARLAGLEAAATSVPRIVHLSHFDRPSLPETLVKAITKTHEGAIKWAARSLEHNTKAADAALAQSLEEAKAIRTASEAEAPNIDHGIAYDKAVNEAKAAHEKALARAASRHDSIVQQADEHHAQRLANLEGKTELVPFKVDIGSKSHKPGRAILQSTKDALVNPLDSLVRGVTGEESLSPFANRVIKKAEKRTRRQVAAEGEYAIADLVRAAKAAGAGISPARQSELLRTEAQGVTNDALKTYYEGQAKVVKKGRETRQVDAQAKLAGKGKGPMQGEREKAFIEAHRALAQYRTEKLMNPSMRGIGKSLEQGAAAYRDYQPAILAAAANPKSPLHALATAVETARTTVSESTKNVSKLKPTKEQLDSAAYSSMVDKHARSERKLEIAVRKFAREHKRQNPGEGPFRVPFEKPKTLNPFRSKTNVGDVPANTNLSPFLKHSTGELFQKGGYVPQTSAALVNDAIRVQRATNGIEFVHRIIDDKTGLVHEAVAGAPVPDNFVLRSTKNLRAAPKLTADASGATNELATQQAANEMWKASHYEHSTVPASAKPGDYVLVPRPLDEAITRDLGHVGTPAGWANKIFRYRVLYSNPKWAVTNLFGNVIQSSLEGVGPTSYVRALKGSRVPFSENRIPFTDKHLPSMHFGGKPIPLAPGVEQHGFLGAHSSDTSASGFAGRSQDIKSSWAENKRKGALKAAAEITTIPAFVSAIKRGALSFENFSRKATYGKLALDEARRAVDPNVIVRLAKKGRPINKDLQDALEAMARGDEPAAKAAANRAVDRMNGVLGDYTAMPQVAKIDAAVPFWKWFYFIGGLTLRMPFAHPKAYALWAAASRVGDQVNQNLGGDLMLPGQQGTFPISGDPKDALTMNFSHASPFGTAEEVISNPLGVVPLLSTTASAVTGRDVGSGRPLLNEKGQNFSVNNQGTEFQPPSDTNRSDITRYLVSQLLVNGPLVSRISKLLGGAQSTSDTSIPLPYLTQKKQPTKADFAALTDKSPFAKPSVNGFSHEELAMFIYNMFLPGNLKRTNLSGPEIQNAVRVGKQMGLHIGENNKAKIRRDLYPAAQKAARK